jgi:large subunit ribosomal protein L30
MAALRVTYRVSSIGHPQRQKDTVRSLGLRHLHQSIILPDRAEVRGMLRRIAHLVEFEELPDERAAGQEE